MKEIWKDVPGYEGLYQASNLGAIKSLGRQMNNRWGSTTPRGGRILQPETTNRGYRRVVLCRDEQYKKWAVHRLILLSFIGECPDSWHVNHRDGNTTNNALDNLEYVTPQMNVAHSMNDLNHPRHGEFNHEAKLTDSRVSEIRTLFASGKFTKRELGKQFGVSEVLIGKIVRGEAWKHLLYDEAG